MFSQPRSVPGHPAAAPGSAWSARLRCGLAALGLCSAMLWGATASAQSGELPTLRAVSDPGFAPFEYQDPETHQLQGFDIDLIKALAPLAGFKVEITALDFSGIIPALQTGSYDIGLSGITITDARKRVIDFSSPYYNSGIQLLVPSSNDSIHQIDDLNGKRVATVLGSTSYNYLQEHLGSQVTIVPYSTSSTAFMAALSGSADAALYDQPNVAYFAQTGSRGRGKVVGPVYEGQQYGIALPKGSKWREPVDQALNTLRENGTYAELYRKWFKTEPSAELLQPVNAG